MATSGQTGPQECAGCGKKIHDKFILKVSRRLNVYLTDLFLVTEFTSHDFFMFTKGPLVRGCFKENTSSARKDIP
jgi:hypothetical protein